MALPNDFHDFVPGTLYDALAQCNSSSSHMQREVESENRVPTVVPAECIE
jgi:hypothetical protein